MDYLFAVEFSVRFGEAEIRGLIWRWVGAFFSGEFRCKMRDVGGSLGQFGRVTFLYRDRYLLTQFSGYRIFRAHRGTANF